MLLSIVAAIWTLVCVLIGLFIGYALTRKQQGEVVIERKPEIVPAEPEKLIEDEFNRALFSPEELAAMSSGRIPTITE